MDPMQKMWLSLVALLIMALSVVVVTLARTKTKGFIRGILSVAAFMMMIIGFILGLASII
ncbi:MULTISPECIES: DUF2768 family protein [Paenibacillus]|uniref:DUF2768 domain-containing protein n=1 Tax=Paenibacillus campinasensis TaxID=66347 RepID=A0A268F2Z0_9BACL|nr:MULTISPECIES: DUF2768 family protein [Paenibacillus]MUG64989.1 DUF2768 family protein [Paenibacillus campinasensis]PAD79704.1 DUF2768 domain-containing protein [Paenibacillus campinasensis]PAK53567.1 DUF2768 domain-containing protein [Paenibacillus sp. 7541]